MDTIKAIVVLFGILVAGFCVVAITVADARSLPAIISTQDLAGKTIRDVASNRCFAVVQQDGQPRFVPSDCPHGK